jgi:hypothetical protein
MNARSRHLIEVAGALAVLVGSVSCGNVARTGRSPSFLVIDSMTAASGAIPGTFGAPLHSDVVTFVKKTVNGVDTQVPTIFNDLGKVTLRILLKDPGSPGAAAAPSEINAITVNRYHVEFIRADGRNVQGIDVPYAFDGALTGPVTASPVEFGFEIVRAQAKEEAPLKALAFSGGSIFISTLANVTFYGHDQAGNEVSVSGSIGVDFADWGDPA